MSSPDKSIVQSMISQQKNAIETITEQFLQSLDRMNDRLCSLEHSVKNIETLLQNQQRDTADINKRLRSLEELSRQSLRSSNPPSGFNLNQQRMQPPSKPSFHPSLCTTIDETQFEEQHTSNHNHPGHAKKNDHDDDNYQLQEMELDDEDFLSNIASSSGANSNHDPGSCSNSNNRYPADDDDVGSQRRNQPLSSRYASAPPQPIGNHVHDESSIPPSITLLDDVEHRNDIGPHHKSVSKSASSTEMQDPDDRDAQKENIAPSIHDNADDDMNSNNGKQMNNNKDIFGLLGLQTLDATNASTDIEHDPNERQNGDKPKEDDREHNVDLDVLFSSFESTTTMATTAMTNNDFETALGHLQDGFDELHRFVPDLNALSVEQRRAIAIAYCNQGICFAKLQKYAQATTAVNMCISLRENWFKPYSTMAAIYAYQKIYSQALKMYDRALQLVDDDDMASKVKIKNRRKSICDRMLSRKRSRQQQGEENIEESPAKRMKCANNNDDESNMARRMADLRIRLNGKTVSELQTMLEINKQKKTGRKAELIERCIDGILNGAIPRCPKCAAQGRGNRSYLKYSAETGCYSCGGVYDKTAQRKIECDFSSKDVRRTPWSLVKKT